MQSYVDILKTNGLKSTFQRLQILETISMCGHKDIDEIYSEVVAKYPTISLATVYKNLIIMNESGVLREVPIVGKKSKYEINKADHLHLVCNHCGSIEDHPMESLFGGLANKEDFVLEKQEINLYGICSKCHNQKAS